MFLNDSANCPTKVVLNLKV